MCHAALEALLAEVLSLPFDDVEIPIPNREIEWLERHTNIVYPALAALAVLVFAFFFVRAWRTTTLDVNAKIQFKKAIVQLMREHITGLTGETIAREIGLDKFKTVGLLEEMQRDGIVTSHTTTKRLTMWRLRGISGSFGST